MASRIAPVALDAEVATFIQGGVAIDLATRDPRNIPRLARGIACRVSPDRHRVAVIVANRMIDRFVEALQATRAIAVVFCLASTHRAVQIKGADAAIEPVLETDHALVEEAIRAFEADICGMGFPEGYGRVETTYRPAELVAIGFTISGVFAQTPGPGAGRPL